MATSAHETQSLTSGSDGRSGYGALPVDDVGEVSTGWTAKVRHAVRAWGGNAT